MQQEEIIIIGGGPCGLSCALALQKHGINPLIIEKGNIVNTIYNYPTHQMFFSSSEKLEIGDVAFITEKKKPVRNEALVYYRAVADRKNLRIHPFEKVTSIRKQADNFEVHATDFSGNEKKYRADQIIIATGYYDQPNYLNIPGEELPKVMHYFKEAHPYYNQDVVIIGGKNSAIDAALELHKAGANITVLYRGAAYSESIKPWILPEFDMLVKNETIKLEFNAAVTKITGDEVEYDVSGISYRINNNFIFAMTGYQPDIPFLENIGIEIKEENGSPSYNEETYETNILGIYVAGVVTAGYNNNRIFIENGRFHGEKIADSIMKKHR